MSRLDSSRYAFSAQAYYPGQAYNTPAMLQLAASVNPFSGRLLDIGCGDGQLLKLLLERFPDVKLSGLTVSEDERQISGEKFDVRVGDMHILPWEDAYFDVVISRHSLEHSISPLTALFEVNRVLRLDGVFHVVVPAPASEWVIKWKDHFSVLPKAMWEKLFEDAGFGIEKFEEGDWLASFSMQSELEMRFVLRKVRDIKDNRVLSLTTTVADVPVSVERAELNLLSPLVERKILVVLHNLVLFDAIRPVAERFGRDVKFIVPLTGDAGFDAMGKLTKERIMAAGFEVERVALPVDARCEIELSPYPYASKNVRHATWRVRFMYGLAKEAWNFSLDNNVYYDFVLAYGDYDSRIISAYSTPVRVGNPKIESIKRTERSDDILPVLLYLPTYGPTSSIDEVSLIRDQLKAQYRVIAKAHHGTTYFEPERLNLLQAWVDELAHHDTSLSSLLARADVVLSDGSGAIFDAIAAEVPIAIFQSKVFSGLGGAVSLEERIVMEAQIPATEDVDEVGETLARALKAGSAPLEALRNELFDALGSDAADRAAKFLLDLLVNAHKYNTFAVARRMLQTRLQEGEAQRVTRAAAERQFDETYRKLTDRLLADVQAALKTVADRDEHITSLAQALGDRDEHITSLAQALGDCEGQIAILNRTLGERDRQVTMLANEIDGLASMYEAIRNSRSWRVTKPLRFVVRLSRRGLLEDDRRSFERKLRSIFKALPLSASSKMRIKSWYTRLFGRPLPDSSAQPVFLRSPQSGAQCQSSVDELAGTEGGDFLAPEHWEHQKKPYGVVVLPIIDWHFRFQRPQQIARRFAMKGHPVAYVSLNFGSELAVAQIEHGIESLWLPGSGSTNVYQEMPNEADIDRLTAALRQYLTASTPHGTWVCIVQLPYWGPVAEQLRAQVGCAVVYDCMDDHAGFSTNGEDMLAAEARLLRQADLVVASSDTLFNKVRFFARRTALIRNAVDYGHFAVVPETSHSPVSNLIVGYYGAIADWFDSALVAEVAQLRPSWRIILIGSTFSGDTEPLISCPNISLLGEKPYAELPQLIADWDCCIIPFKRLPLTEATNPVKIYEMLAAGKPVVSVSLPELLPIADKEHISLSDTAAEFVVEIENQVLQDSALRQEARRRYAAENTWEVRQEALDKEIVQTYPLVSIVVVTYNNLALNRLCLESLFEDTDYPNYEVIVIDNASSDGTPAYLQSLQYSGLTVVLNDVNRGFSAANNQGLAKARGEFLCLLNNDTVVTGSWLSTLVRHLRANPDIGLVGPVTNAIGNEAKIPVGYRNLLDLPKWSSAYCLNKSGSLVDVSMLAFFCVVMPRSVFESVGFLDDRFGLGMFEDDDYNRRVREAGYMVKLAQDAFVHHWQRASFKLLGEDAYLETFYDNEKKYRAKWAASELRKEDSEKLAGLIAASEASARTIIFAPSIGWNVHLFQRPHHLARVLAQDGFTVVFDCSNAHDDIGLLKEVEPRLFLYKGTADLLAGLHKPTLWTFTYNYDYRDFFPRNIPIIYDWIDDLSVFPYDQMLLAQMHSRAMKEATVVASVARRLHESALVERPDAIYLPNAVEEGRFEHPPTPNPALEDDVFSRVVSSGKPIAGYYGALARWFDYELLAQTAELRPDWHFILIGPDHDGSISQSPLKNHRNITWLGAKDYQALPGYLHLFDVAMIPFKINDITLATSPLKLFEYFAGGKPVVSTPMPECAAFSEVYIVGSADEFAATLDAARTSAKTSEYLNHLAALANENTWRARARKAMAALVNQTVALGGGGRAAPYDNVSPA